MKKALAILLSALLLGEPLTGLSIIGAVLIIGSAVFSEWRSDGKSEG